MQRGNNLSYDHAERILNAFYRVDPEQLDDLLDRGFIEDILRANVLLVSRNDFRRALGLLTTEDRTSVSYHVPPDKKLWGYSGVNGDFSPDMFPEVRSGVHDVELGTVILHEVSSIKGMFDDLKKRRVRMASLAELLAYGLRHQDPAIYSMSIVSPKPDALGMHTMATCGIYDDTHETYVTFWSVPPVLAKSGGMHLLVVREENK